VYSLKYLKFIKKNFRFYNDANFVAVMEQKSKYGISGIPAVSMLLHISSKKLNLTQRELCSDTHHETLLWVKWWEFLYYETLLWVKWWAFL